MRRHRRSGTRHSSCPPASRTAVSPAIGAPFTAPWRHLAATRSPAMQHPRRAGDVEGRAEAAPPIPEAALEAHRPARARLGPTVTVAGPHSSVDGGHSHHSLPVVSGEQKVRPSPISRAVRPDWRLRRHSRPQNLTRPLSFDRAISSPERAGDGSPRRSRSWPRCLQDDRAAFASSAAIGRCACHG